MKILSAILLLASAATKAADINELPALVPAYGEIPPTFWEQHGTMILAGSATLITLAVLILWKILQPKPAVVLPPETLAFEALTKLLRQPEDGKLLSEVSRVLRRYVTAAFDLPAAELTTAEFCTALAVSEKIGAELANLIASFLRECDQRKFSTLPAAATLNAAARALELIPRTEARRAQLATATSPQR